MEIQPKVRKSRLTTDNLTKINDNSIILDEVRFRYCCSRCGETADNNEKLAHLVAFNASMSDGEEYEVYVSSISKNENNQEDTDYIRVFGDYVVGLTTDDSKAMAFNEVLDALDIADYINYLCIVDTDVRSIFYQLN